MFVLKSSKQVNNLQFKVDILFSLFQWRNVLCMSIMALFVNASLAICIFP
jgi:hypothetical protein